MTNHVPIIVVLAAAILAACASTVDRSGSVLVTGRMDRTPGIDSCWILEAGTGVRNKTFYQVQGTESLMRRLRKRGSTVSVYLAIDSAATGPCPVGTVATVRDVVSVTEAP